MNIGREITNKHTRNWAYFLENVVDYLFAFVNTAEILNVG